MALARWRSSFSNVPPLTKTVATAMTFMTALGFVFRLRDMVFTKFSNDAPESVIVIQSEDKLIPLLALVPASALYHFWTFATASFFERNIFMYAIHMAILLGSGKYLERAWGSRELFKFLGITSVGTMFCIYFTCLFDYVVRSDGGSLYDAQAYGMTGVVAGFLIGFKQHVPEHIVTIWGVLSLRVKSLPLLFVLFMAVGRFFSHTWIHFLTVIYGLFIAWIYSRFFRVQDGIQGDRSETFSFASFFPEWVQPLVKALSNACFGLLVRLKICSGTGYGGSFQYDLENPQMAGMGHTFTRPGSLRAEAERRRALALKALDMRLHAAAGNNTSGTGRSTFLGSSTTSNAAPVSLLSLSAEPLPTDGDDDDDEVLFETTALDVNEPAGVKRS